VIAFLPMYARPELHEAHDRYWTLIRDGLRSEGIDAPERLTTSADERETWHDPQLLLGHTCGLPYRRWLHDDVQLVGTPDYDVEGCPPGWYRSAVICRRDNDASTLGELAGGTFAFNTEDSQSGFVALMSLARQESVEFANRLETGAHVRSAAAVAAGQADLAAIDAVSWRNMLRYDDFTSQLRVALWTAPTPGLPYIAAPGVNVEALRSAIDDAIEGLAPPDHDVLGITGLVRISSQLYLDMDDND